MNELQKKGLSLSLFLLLSFFHAVPSVAVDSKDSFFKTYLSSIDFLDKSGDKSPKTESIRFTENFIVLADNKTGDTGSTGKVETPEEDKSARSQAEPRFSGQYYISRAWKYYRDGNYQNSIDLFIHASSFPETEFEAKLGLAYSYTKKKMPDKAISYFRELVDNNFRLGDSLPGLVSLLIEVKKYEKAESLLEKFSKNRKEKFKRRIDKAVLKSKFEKAKNKGDRDTIIALSGIYYRDLKRCFLYDDFQNVAKELFLDGKKDDAKTIYLNMLTGCRGKKNMGLGIIYNLEPLMHFNAMQKLLSNEIYGTNHSRRYVKKVTKIKLDLLRKKISTTPQSSPEIKNLFEEILKITPDDVNVLSTAGWWSYNHRQYRSAYDRFKILNKRFPDNENYALGLAFTLAKLTFNDQALKLSEMFPPGAIKLTLLKEMMASSPLASRQQQDLAGQILEIDPYDEPALAAVSWWSYNKNRFKEAYEAFFRLNARFPENEEYAKGLIYSLIKLDRNYEAFELADKYEFKDVKLMFLKERLAAAQPSSREAGMLAEEILAIEPRESTAIAALSVMPWEHYKKKRYRDAYKEFTALNNRYPENDEYALGLAYTAMHLNKVDKAFKIAEKYEKKNKEFLKIKEEIYLKRGLSSYNDNDYVNAEEYLKKYIKLVPDDLPVKTMIAWSIYNQGRIKEALPFFREVHSKESDLDISKIILSIYDQTRAKRDGFKFARSIAESEKEGEEMKRLAGEFFYRNSMPVTAARLNSDHEKCYFNLHQPLADGIISYRHKSGDSGFSRLDETRADIAFSYPLKWQNEISFTITPSNLSSGSAPEMPFAGNFFNNSIVGQKNKLVTSASVITPGVRFETEGEDNYSIELGTTPLKGIISSLPTFAAGLNKGKLGITLYQLPVNESILSYVGLKDPYGDDKWGRVVKRGIQGGRTFSLTSSSWFTIKGGGDLYSGKNIWGNSSLNSSATIGNSKTIEKGVFSYGLFLTASKFKRNTNFFTFGHGGYYSPKLFFMAGPLMSFRTKPCSPVWVEVDISMGYLKSRTETAPYYPLNRVEIGSYNGESSSGLGYRIKLKAFKLLKKPKWAVGSFLDINNSSGYTEWNIGLSLRYLFSPRNIPLKNSVKQFGSFLK